MNAVASRNISFISHCDQGDRGDGVQVMVHRGYAYIGHGFSNGITVIDVRDPKKPKTVDFLPAPPNTRALHLQTHGFVRVVCTLNLAKSQEKPLLRCESIELRRL